MIYVRWRNGEFRRGRGYPPLAPTHPSVEHPCPACGNPVGTTTPVQLVIVGPTDAEDRERHYEGRWYTAGAVVVHQSCADAIDDDELDRLVDYLVVIGVGEGVVWHWEQSDGSVKMAKIKRRDFDPEAVSHG